RPGAAAGVHLARDLDVLGLALGGEALVAEPRRPAELAHAHLLQERELGPALPGPGVGAAGVAAGHLGVVELAQLAEVLVAHPLRRRLAERSDLLRREPRPGVGAAADPAGDLLVGERGEERGLQRRRALIAITIAAAIVGSGAAIAPATVTSLGVAAPLTALAAAPFAALPLAAAGLAGPLRIATAALDVLAVRGGS